MAKLNGSKLRVLVNGVAIAGATSFTLDGDDNLLSTSDKDSAGWEENEYGRRSWTVSVDALYDPSGVYTAEEIIDLMINRNSITSLEVAQIDGVGGGHVWSGIARLKSFSLKGNVDEIATISAIFNGSGPLTKGTVPAS